MPDAGAELDALAQEFYAVWFRCRPDLAPAAGVRPAGGWLEALILGLDEMSMSS
jgi:hypothetical protein